ncbi:MAG: AMP-binding protein [Bacilli bacterium]|nr:AMP-binding protein [Bacilli bacterium]
MKDREIEIMIKIMERQLGHKPSELEINNMKRLLSVQVNNVEKVEKAINALDEVYTNEKCSWYDGQYSRNKDKLDECGIYYRGNYIKKREVFSRAREIAKGMYANGLRKGDSFSACVSNIPDLLTTLLATSYIGAKINIFDSSFNKEYIKKIIDSCDASFVFCSDDQYDKIDKVLDDTKIEKRVLLSLADHLPDKFPDYYKNVPEEMYKFENKALKYKENSDNVVLIDDFIEEGKEYNEEDIKDKNPSIYDIFTITYSSGTSRPDRPKAIPHNVLSYLTMMRFHDEDMMGLPKSAKLNDIVGLAHIPPISDTNVKSVISDTFGQGSVVAFEPIYGPDTLIYSIIMNRPNFCDATLSGWKELAKKIYFDKQYANIDLSFLVLPLSVGGPLEVNERNFIDKAFKKTHAGSDVLKKWKLPLTHTFLGEGGGRTESGGIVYTILQGLNEKIYGFKLKKRRYGMVPTLATDIVIVDKNGNECNVNEIGELCADSPCSMANNKYLFDEDNNNNYFVFDNYGRKIPRFDVYAYRNELGNIIMKGRMGNEFKVEGKKIPEFLINDIILSDRKRILSSEVLNYNNSPIVDLEINPLYLKGKNKSEVVANVLLDANNKCMDLLPEELAKKIVFRVRDDKYNYPQSHCAKRDVSKMLEEKYNNCFKPMMVDGNIILMNAENYFDLENNVSYRVVRKESPFKKIKNKVRKLKKQNKF